MKKRVRVACVLITTMLIMTGCCLSHEWEEATCVTPKTCVKCGKIEGKTIEHIWIDATCSEAKHCSMCDLTEGEPLEHNLVEANYQQGSRCTVCGTEVGEPLQADFEKYGFECFAELGETYDLNTQCNQDINYPTTGKITFTPVEGDKIDREYEELEGYEWQVVVVTLAYTDEIVKELGCTAPSLATDYYNITAFDDSYNEDTDTWSVNYNGQEYTECKVEYESLYNSWTYLGTRTLIMRYSARVPIGYDGIVINYFDRYSQEKTSEMDTWYTYDAINENTVSFRLSSQCAIKDKIYAEPVSIDALTTTEAWTILEEEIKPVYECILYNEGIKSFYDLNKDGNLDEAELDRFYGWIFVNTDENGTSSLKQLDEEKLLKAVKIWIEHDTVNEPDYVYYFEEGKQILYK